MKNKKVFCICMIFCIPLLMGFMNSIIGTSNYEAGQNILKNGGFEEFTNYRSYEPLYWEKDDCRIYSYASGIALEGQRYCMVKQIQDGACKIYQKLDLERGTDFHFEPSIWILLYYGELKLRFVITTVVDDIVYEYPSEWVSIIGDHQSHEGQYIQSSPIILDQVGSDTYFYVEIDDLTVINYLYLDDVKLELSILHGTIPYKWDYWANATWAVASVPSELTSILTVRGNTIANNGHYWIEAFSEGIGGGGMVAFEGITIHKVRKGYPTELALELDSVNFTVYPWLVTSKGIMYRYGYKWDVIDGPLAQDIAFDRKGNGWMVPQDGDELYFRKFGTNTWEFYQYLPFEGKEIGVVNPTDDEFYLWIVSDDNETWEGTRLNPAENFDFVNRSYGLDSYDIACDLNSRDNVFIIAGFDTRFGHPVYKWDSTDIGWDRCTNGLADKIGLYGDIPWVINREKKLFEGKELLTTTNVETSSTEVDIKDIPAKWDCLGNYHLDVAASLIKPYYAYALRKIGIRVTSGFYWCYWIDRYDKRDNSRDLIAIKKFYDKDVYPVRLAVQKLTDTTETFWCAAQSNTNMYTDHTICLRWRGSDYDWYNLPIPSSDKVSDIAGDPYGGIWAIDSDKNRLMKWEESPDSWYEVPTDEKPGELRTLDVTWEFGELPGPVPWMTIRVGKATDTLYELEMNRWGIPSWEYRGISGFGTSDVGVQPITKDPEIYLASYNHDGSQYHGFLHRRRPSTLEWVKVQKPDTNPYQEMIYRVSVGMDGKPWVIVCPRSFDSFDRNSALLGLYAGELLPHGSPSSEPWQVGETYQIGDIVSYNDILYECIQAHTVYDPNWTPPNTPALWRRL